MSRIDRRSFLKMLGGAAPAILFPQIVSLADKTLGQSGSEQPNVIILLFDAMSARNLSVYGYPRPTTPNLERFAEHSIVYHSHHASANFTIPATSSLLTGTYPWTHRAINHRGMVRQDVVDKNVFRSVGSGYSRLAFPQNVWSDLIVSQFANDIDTFLPSSTYAALDYLKGESFSNDENMAVRSLDDFVFKEHEQASIFLAPLLSAMYFRDVARLPVDKGYPRGLPHNANYPLYFKLEDIFDGLASLVPGLRSTFAYFHLYPPHAPYRASSRFDRKFLDNFHPLRKPVHRFSSRSSNSRLESARRFYDEYVASIDWEIGNLFDVFEKEGVFENSYVIVTADHGEMFERGEVAHTTPLLYAPVTNIPLLISAPGQKNRQDVYAPTNAVDLLPTITQLTGGSKPDWAEGTFLPGLGGSEDFERSTFSVEAKRVSAFGSLHIATVSMYKGTHKLIYYTGYEGADSFELYNLESDIEEMEDLYPAQPAIAKKLKEELLETFLQADKPYSK
ncbi:MAG: sulfatase-like hydrolase/transferase [Anaerolineales bacterium]|nr:sulfatase-like hydrolase/transferase [Anaerolineales bacterium]